MSCSLPIHVKNNILEGLLIGCINRIEPSPVWMMYSSSHSAGRSASKLRNGIVSITNPAKFFPPVLTLRRDNQKGVLRKTTESGRSLPNAYTIQYDLEWLFRAEIHQNTRFLSSSSTVTGNPGGRFRCIPSSWQSRIPRVTRTHPLCGAEVPMANLRAS